MGAGGFFGAISRYLVTSVSVSPLDIFILNMLGSFFLGIVMFDPEYLGLFSSKTRLGFGIGYLGSFTTFSSFAVMSFQMSVYMSVINIIANVVFTILAVFLGRSFIIYLSTKRW
ncbi:fluoride efflux transporter CrcB [Methanohalobium sp.]|uniref:fluoride efflux transporter CrcB n=1 Tax=Methanohalobium sp. TaxID=2837493 RepID=UPI0025CF9F4B|nr:fluoride efflux transporter CrcB [Methanohalobium sp.]